MLQMFWGASPLRYRQHAMLCSRRGWCTHPSAARWPLPCRTSHVGCGLTHLPDWKAVSQSPMDCVWPRVRHGDRLLDQAEGSIRAGAERGLGWDERQQVAGKHELDRQQVLE